MDATWWIAIAITLVGGVVSGLAGFGFPLVAVPPLLLIYPPPTVVTISIVLSLLTGWVVLPGATRFIDRPLVLRLMPWAALGIFVGAVALQNVETRLVELLASATVLVTSLVLLRGWRIPGADAPAAVAVAGGSSGVLNAMTGMAGPPVAMLFEARRLGVHEFRTSIVAYFVFIDLVAIVLLTWQRVIGREEYLVALALIPGALVGTWLGRLLSERISVDHFRRITLLLLLGTGAVGIIKAVIGGSG